MIWHDYGVLSPENRTLLLGNIRAALRPDGRFAFDVPSMNAFRNGADRAASKWYASDSGFWRPQRHFVLEKTIVYPEISVLCNFVTVLDSEGATEYPIFQTFFSPESIRKELEENGFCVEAVTSNLRGDAYDPASSELGVVCRRPDRIPATLPPPIPPGKRTLTWRARGRLQ
jgi:hypothetical protein